MIKILREYGRAVKFRLGRFVGVKRTSPGILNATAAARHSRRRDPTRLMG